MFGTRQSYTKDYTSTEHKYTEDSSQSSSPLQTKLNEFQQAIIRTPGPKVGRYTVPWDEQLKNYDWEAVDMSYAGSYVSQKDFEFVQNILKRTSVYDPYKSNNLMAILLIVFIIVGLICLVVLTIVGIAEKQHWYIGLGVAIFVILLIIGLILFCCCKKDTLRKHLIEREKVFVRELAKCNSNKYQNTGIDWVCGEYGAWLEISVQPQIIDQGGDLKALTPHDFADINGQAKGNQQGFSNQKTRDPRQVQNPNYDEEERMGYQQIGGFTKINDNVPAGVFTRKDPYRQSYNAQNPQGYNTNRGSYNSRGSQGVELQRGGFQQRGRGY